MTEASYRASLIQAQIRAMRAIPGGAGKRALDTVTEEVAHVDDAPRTSWIAAELSDRIGTAVLRELGRERFVEFWRRFAAQVSQKPLFDYLAKGALRLFASPAGLFKMVPRAWGSVARGVGTVHVEADADAKHCAIRIVEIAPESRIDSLVLSWEGSYLGVMDLVRKSGRVEVDRSRLHEGIVEFSIDWDD